MGNLCYSCVFPYCPTSLGNYNPFFDGSDAQFAVSRPVAAYIWRRPCSWQFSSTVVVPPNQITGGGTYDVSFAVAPDDSTNGSIIGANGLPYTDSSCIPYQPSAGYRVEEVIAAMGQIFGTDAETGGTIGIGRKWALRPYSAGQGSGDPTTPDMGGLDWLATLDVNYSSPTDNFTIYAENVQNAPTQPGPGMQFELELGISVTDYTQEPPAGVIVGACRGIVSIGGNKGGVSSGVGGSWNFWPYYQKAGNPNFPTVGTENPTYNTDTGAQLIPTF